MKKGLLIVLILIALPGAVIAGAVAYKETSGLSDEQFELEMRCNAARLLFAVAAPTVAPPKTATPAPLVPAVKPNPQPQQPPDDQLPPDLVDILKNPIDPVKRPPPNTKNPPPTNPPVAVNPPESDPKQPVNVKAPLTSPFPLPPKPVDPKPAPQKPTPKKANPNKAKISQLVKDGDKAFAEGITLLKGAYEAKKTSDNKFFSENAKALEKFRAACKSFEAASELDPDNGDISDKYAEANRNRATCFLQGGKK